MQSLFYLAVLVAGCWAATTHHPHHTHQPSETESLRFTYVPATKSLVIRTIHGGNIKCYVSVLSDPQQKLVHTDSGLRSLELQLYSQIDAGRQVDVSTLNEADSHACGHAGDTKTIMYFML